MASESPTPPKSNVLLVLFPGFNTLDMNGPYEVLQRSADASVFTVTVASETDITTSVEGVQVKVSSRGSPSAAQRLINWITF